MLPFGSFWQQMDVVLTMDFCVKNYQQNGNSVACMEAVAAKGNLHDFVKKIGYPPGG